MAHPIVMPSFGMYTAEGTLSRWLCPPGTRVTQGEPILEIETEKANYEVPAPASGVLHTLLVAGAQLQEQALLGYVLGDGESPPGSPEQGSPQTEATTHQTSEPPSHPPGGGPPTTPSILKASPIAKRLAAEHGIDLSTLSGTGPGGRIVESDVLAAVERKQQQPAPAHAAARIARPVPFTGMRRMIADRLHSGLARAVPVTLTREVTAGCLVAARLRLSQEAGIAIPFDALFAKFLALGLREVPALNAMVEGETILLFEEVHIAFAVALEDGLVTPVIRNADTVPVTAIARVIEELTAQARGGRLRGEDLEGGTATVSNLGASEIDAFTPVLNPPQSCILGIGRIRPQPVVSQGSVAIAQTCVLSLTFDHRVADGVPSARLLACVERLMNDEAFLTQLR